MIRSTIAEDCHIRCPNTFGIFHHVNNLPASLSSSLPSFILPSLPPSLPPSRHRLKEGFHIARAQSGLVTLTAQLSVSQPHNPTRTLAMLLQYIIFPLNCNPASSSASFSSIIASGYPTCELWVEPQYGTVTEAPAGLQYILGCTHTQIADKVRYYVTVLSLTW